MSSAYFAEIERKDGKKIWILVPYIVKSSSGTLESNYETIPEWVSIEELDNYNLLPNVKEIIEEAKELQ